MSSGASATTTVAAVPWVLGPVRPAGRGAGVAVPVQYARSASRPPERVCRSSRAAHWL
ncbi:hypothetical protein SMD44_08949 [Streptomyces alboflavus]|uniref:Uncharacterized protein n=1 Tax=Streptomyces alboflavus TaxID=67267 RepID=A0A1Z1WSY3_9ACTN|nr:hypothetical protein SMD44_08949 [Streptomyces alboflavus]